MPPSYGETIPRGLPRHCASRLGGRRRVQRLGQCTVFFRSHAGEEAIEILIIHWKSEIIDMRACSSINIVPIIKHTLGVMTPIFGPFFL